METNLTPSDRVMIAMFMKFFIDGAPSIMILFIANEVTLNFSYHGIEHYGILAF